MVEPVRFGLTDGSCAIPRCSVACWEGNRRFLGSWLAAGTSATYACRSLSRWICMQSCSTKTAQRLQNIRHSLSFSYCPNSFQNVYLGPMATFQVHMEQLQMHVSKETRLDYFLSAPVMCFAVMHVIIFPCKQLYVKSVCRVSHFPSWQDFSFNSFPSHRAGLSYRMFLPHGF